MVSPIAAALAARASSRSWSSSSESTLPLGRLEAGVQGRELDGDPGTGDGPESSGGAADRGDGLQITLLVAGRVLSGAGRLAEHVE
jgi:hypothetical protein